MARNKRLRRERGVTSAAYGDEGLQVYLESRDKVPTQSAMKRGVVPGAEPELCPVCACPSEGWFVESGKRTWYHFRRSFNCVERFGHVES